MPSTTMEQPAALVILRGFAVLTPRDRTVSRFQEP